MFRFIQRALIALALIVGSAPAYAQTDNIARGLAVKALVRATPTVLARAPINTDDTAHGYLTGQGVVDSTTGIVWTAISVDASKAVWVSNRRPGFAIVGNRNMIMQSLSTAGTNQVQSYLHYRSGPVQVCNIRVRYTNYYVSSTNVETANGSALTITATLTYGGTTYTLTVGGVATFTAPASSSYVETDPLGICISPATAYSIATFADGGSGNSYIFGIPASTAVADKYENGSALTDKTASPTTIGTTGFFNTYGPSLVIGDYRGGYTPNPILVTDSRGWGGTTGTNNGDTATAAGGDANGCFGYMQRRLCADNIPYVLIGRPSTKPSQWAVIANVQRRLLLVRDVGTVVENNLGINDVTNSVAAVTIAGYLGTINGYFTPLKVVQDTIQPRPTTTDNCATLGNQTLGAYESIRTTLNATIRANTITGQSAFREASTGIEVNASGVATVDGGYWAVTPSLTSNDCLHANAVGAAAVAAAITSDTIR